MDTMNPEEVLECEEDFAAPAVADADILLLMVILELVKNLQHRFRR